MSDTCTDKEPAPPEKTTFASGSIPYGMSFLRWHTSPGQGMLGAFTTFANRSVREKRVCQLADYRIGFRHLGVCSKTAMQVWQKPLASRRFFFPANAWYAQPCFWVANLGDLNSV
mmetsp:Transcript_79337/g.137562  ORF Transcript_79337/g.137562 Transcript_79337/m.137562 type:complete len:115 (+) Transcript_79337:689-1033(+)